MNGPTELSQIDSILPDGTDDLKLTFRDPAGQLRLTARHALRQIRSEAAEATLAFLSSPLRAALEMTCDLIPSKIATPDEYSCIAPGELWLKHPRIDPISYPWEWTPAQWRAAADLTLRIASQAIEAGWTLKDATPLNVLFSGPRPVLVDVLSFEQRDPHSTVWLAYGQFVRTFLLPLVAEKYVGWSLQATIFARDGYEPGGIYDALSPWQRLIPNMVDVVTLARILERQSGKPHSSQEQPTVRDPELAVHILQKRIARLRKQVRQTAKTRSGSQWSEYARSANHYSATDAAEKQEFVKNVIQRCGPARVLDIGANTGTYSQIAADCGAEVVALDADAAALEELQSTAAQGNRHITTLVANIARPTPAAGWMNGEQLSLLDRLTGKFDLVLMLAVIHHLILREQIPLAHIAELCAQLTTQWLVLEWVPPADPMYQEWLRGRDHLYGHLSEDDLQQAFLPHFAVADRMVLGNSRVLFLLERTSNDRAREAAFPGSLGTEARPA